MTNDTPSAESPLTDQEEGRIPATTAGEEGAPSGTKLLKTAIAALGIVFGDIGMSRNSQNVTTYFRLPADRVIEIGMQVEI